MKLSRFWPSWSWHTRYGRKRLWISMGMDNDLPYKDWNIHLARHRGSCWNPGFHFSTYYKSVGAFFDITYMRRSPPTLV